MRMITISALTALSLSTFATPVAAQDTREVLYGDLDLSGTTGRTALRQRVAQAIEQVCGKADVRNLHSGNQVADCRIDTWVATQGQLTAALDGSVRILADAKIAISHAAPVRGPAG